MALKRPIDPTETATGRKIGYELIPGTSLYRIKHTAGGGTMPAKYSGLYTSIREVEEAVVRYVDETFSIAEAHMPNKRA